jgi:two-component system cell cycle sensor histidine kinase/response regulator CckA
VETRYAAVSEIDVDGSDMGDAHRYGAAEGADGSGRPRRGEGVTGERDDAGGDSRGSDERTDHGSTIDQAGRPRDSRSDQTCVTHSGRKGAKCSSWVRSCRPRRSKHGGVPSEPSYLQGGTLFRELVENLPMVTYVDLPGCPSRTLYVSSQIEPMLGYPTQQWLDDPDLLFKVLHPDDLDRIYLARRAGPDEQDSSHVFRVVSIDGREFTIRSERVIVRDDRGVPVRILGFWVDVTDQMRLEEGLRQAQKLEALGRLAGGIAHDFNNLLLAQRGYGELALQHLDASENGAAADDVAEMLDAAERASRLTGQLLAFARRQMLNPEILDLSAVVSDLDAMLRQLVGKDVTVAVRTADVPVFVRADRGQLEQVIVNLTVNARDAMPDGGRLDIRIAQSGDGATATLEVRDDGVGMDDATAARIFDPFFTTKDSEGTGLGLATVHGIVSQSGGRISVVSSPGAGTTFTIVLPAAVPAHLPSAGGEEIHLEGGGEAVLLVENEDSVRASVSAMLQARGYRVHPARSGEEALEVARRHGGELHLLLTDMILPGASGRETAGLVRTLRPDICVVYMSGFVDGSALPGADGIERSSFIKKPFTGDELAHHLRVALGTHPA